MQSEKDNYVFYYRLPMDRLKQIMMFGWCAVWNGNLYSDNFDLNLYDDPESIKNNLIEKLNNFTSQVDNSWRAVEAEQGQKGEYSSTISEVANSISKQGGFLAVRIAELMHSLIHNEQVPLALRNALKEHFEAKQ